MRVLELYSGIGGMHYALRESTIKGQVVASVDINTTANKVYRHNFPKTNNLNRNIQSFTAEEIIKLNIECILMSPPCQPFTRVGLKKDSNDNRCSSLLHLLQIIPHIKTLKYILLENVKGFESSQARDEVVSCLENSEFRYQEFILSPCQFGIPNSRHRYYLIAKKKGMHFAFNNLNGLSSSLPEEILQILPKRTFKPLDACNIRDLKCFKLKDILETDVDNKYLISEKVLVKRGNLLDIRTPESEGSCCFTKAYTHFVEGTGSTLSPFPDSVIHRTFEEFNTSLQPLEIKARDLLDLRIRYFTPKEVSKLMCFPEDFEFPNDLSDKQKYRLLGNSINVFVVSQLIYLLHCDETVAR